MAARLVDLSHPLEDGMSVYPGLPSPSIGAFLSHEGSRPRYQGKAEFYMGRIEMVGNVATYLDAPFHRFRDAPDLADLPLESVAGLEGIFLDVEDSAERAISPKMGEDELEGRAVLVGTGWDARWGTERYWEPGPCLARDFVDLLLRSGARLVGVDFWNVDDPDDASRPAHTRLLAEGILIVEHLANLSALPRTGFRFHAVPPRIVQGASFPVRAFAEILE